MEYIVGLIILGVMLYLLIRYSKSPDTKPYTFDVTVATNPKGTIKLSDLKYTDKEGDAVNKVRFFATKGLFFKDSELKIVYEDGELLSPDFILYYDLGKLSSISIIYDVRTKSKWS